MLSGVRSVCCAGLAALVAVSVACGGTVKAPRQRLTPKQMVERSKPGIVRIEVWDRQGQPGIGTGFFVARDGRLATNLHVINGTVKADVVMHDGTKYPVSRVVAIDEAHNLAIVSIERPNDVRLVLGDSDKVSAGDPVFAIGNPLGADYTISDGLISAVRQLDQTTVLQISAPISQGSSGGPLLNHYGEVIGVATLVSAEGQNLNFGMPSNYLRPMVDQTGGWTFAQFAQAQASNGQLGNTIGQLQGDRPRTKIRREVPSHPVELLEGCTDDEIMLVAREIAGAIEKGAPIYNSGDHEACFRIYEGVALRLENTLPKTCLGPREALGQGLLKAETKEGYTLKAWAMRDAFDGLLDVITRRLRASSKT